MLTPEQVKTVVEKYGPTLHLHPDEKYLLSSVEWFLDRATLYVNGDKVSTPNGLLNSLPQGDKATDKTWLSIPKEARGGDMSSAVAYVHAKAPKAGYTDVMFWFFYPYNGPGTAKAYPVDNSISLAPFGEHTGDWEHITLRIDEKTLMPTGIYLAQHADGEWINIPAHMPVSMGKLNVYSSRNGHATYHDTGSNLTEHSKEKVLGQTIYEVGLRNDTANGGKTLDCSKRYQLLDGNEPRWLNFNGRWGPVIDSSKAIKEALDDIPSPVNKPLKSILNSVPDEVKGSSGPTGPKMKGCWDNEDKA